MLVTMMSPVLTKHSQKPPHMTMFIGACLWLRHQSYSISIITTNPFIINFRFLSRTTAFFNVEAGLRNHFWKKHFRRH